MESKGSSNIMDTISSNSWQMLCRYEEEKGVGFFFKHFIFCEGRCECHALVGEPRFCLRLKHLAEELISIVMD